MVKRFRRILSLFTVCALLAGLLAAFPVSADDASEVRYTQKVVAVVYDNSGSMSSGLRIPAAKYSLSMLMSLLDERDVMRIVPMNESPDGGIEVDLSSKNRDGMIDKIIAETVLDYNPNGGTPSYSMTKAVSILEELGLKNKDHLIESDPDKEYWLVILTDGLFDNDTNPGQQAIKIIDSIGDYPTLHTVYTSFSDGAIDLSDRPELKSLPFLNSYCKVPEIPTEGKDDLVAVMQKIANQISGRYPLGDSQFTVDKNKVTINLAQIPFSISSLSVIAQNCGATVKSVKYENSAIEALPKVTLDKICTVKPDSSLGIVEGCSFKTVTDSYLYGGSLVYEFSGPVSIDELSIFAEPALDISTYLETMVNGSAERVNAQYINENLGKGDKIRVGYEVLEQVTGSAIDLEKVFGNVETKVIYNQKSFKIGEDIPLEVGSNGLSIEVTVMDGAFTLRRSELITVEEDPSFFRIEVQGDSCVEGSEPKASAVFTVFVNNAPATKELLKSYDCNLVIKSSGDKIISDKKVEPDDDGKFAVQMKFETNKFDVLTFELTVKTPEFLSRTKAHSVTYAPSSLNLGINGEDHITLTQNQIRDNKEGFVFELSTNGQPFPFENGLTQFKLTAGNTDLTAHAKIDNNKLTFYPTSDTLSTLAETTGDYEIKLDLSSATNPNLAATASAKLTIEDTVYSVVPVVSPDKNINRFKLSECGAALFFSVCRDDVPLTEDELKAAMENGEIEITKTPLFNFFLFPAGTTTTVETVNATPVIAIRAVKDMATYFEWHFSAFITGGEKEVTVSYSGATGRDNFTVIPSNIFQHILRIALLVLEILAVCYIIVYLMGFAIAKPLRTGVLIKINTTKKVTPTPINGSFMPLLKWHLERFYKPWLIWKNQNPMDQASFSGTLLSHSKRHLINLTPTGKDLFFKLTIDDIYSDVFREFHANVNNGNIPNNLGNIMKNHSVTDVKDLFQMPMEGTEIPKQTMATMSSEVYYGCYAPSDRGDPVFRYAIVFKAINTKKK